MMRFYVMPQEGAVLENYRIILRPVLLSLTLLLASNALAGAQPELKLYLGLPHVNSFYLQPESEPEAKASIGFWGASGGLEYHYSADRFFLLTAGAVTDFFLPVPAAVDLVGDREDMSAYWVSLTHHHMIHRFDVGYGLWYGRKTWEYIIGEEPEREPAFYGSESLGPVVCGSYRVSGGTFLTLGYRPGLVRFGSRTDMKYEHVISLGVAWRFKVL